MLVHRRSLPCNLLGFINNSPVPIYIYTWVEKTIVRVKCLAQEHNTMSPRPGLETRPLDPGMSALAMRQPRLHKFTSSSWQLGCLVTRLAKIALQIFPSFTFSLVLNEVTDYEGVCGCNSIWRIGGLLIVFNFPRR